MDTSLHRPVGNRSFTTTWDEAVQILAAHDIPLIAPLVKFAEQVARSPYAIGTFSLRAFQHFEHLMLRRLRWFGRRAR